MNIFGVPKIFKILCVICAKMNRSEENNAPWLTISGANKHNILVGYCKKCQRKLFMTSGKIDFNNSIQKTNINNNIICIRRKRELKKIKIFMNLFLMDIDSVQILMDYY